MTACRRNRSSAVIPAGFLVFMLKANIVLAAPPPTFSESMGMYNTFINNLSVLLSNIINDGNIGNFVNIQWTTFAIFLLVIAATKYILSDLNVLDLIYPLLMVMVTRLLIDNYAYLTSLCWDLSEGISSGIQQAAIGYSDLFILTAFIKDVLDGIEYNNVSWWSVYWVFFASNVMFSIVFVFSVLAFIVNAWALYGYALARIIGLFFVPFLMLKRAAFLFDGWMRLFVGFLVYGVIGRVNLILAVIALKTLFGIPGYAINTSHNIRWDITGLADIIGLAGFMLVGLLALISTGRFAGAVVSGASGFGSSISAATHAIARMTKGGI